MDDLLDMIVDLQRRVEYLESSPSRSRFRPPTIEEITERMKERNLTNFTAEAFHAFYQSNGWMVGRNKMKSWDAALTTWAQRGHVQLNQPFARPVKHYSYSDICQMALTNDNVWKEYMRLQLPDKPSPVYVALKDVTNDLLKYKVQ